MTNSEQGGQLLPGKYRSITVETSRGIESFTSEPELHYSVLGPAPQGFYSISIADDSAPAGEKTVWQQRVENGTVERANITAETL
jgi:hypothetical protein